MRASQEMGLVEAIAVGTKTSAELANITKCDERLIGMVCSVNCPDALANQFSSYPEASLRDGSILRRSLPDLWSNGYYKGTDSTSCGWFIQVHVRPVPFHFSALMAIGTIKEGCLLSIFRNTLSRTAFKSLQESASRAPLAPTSTCFPG